MLGLATIYILWTVWTVTTAVTASPILVQNVTHTSSLEQRAPSHWDLYLGKIAIGSSRERWSLFFAKTGVGFTTSADLKEETTKIAVIKRTSHASWTMIDLDAKVMCTMPEKDELFRWIEHDMIPQLRQPAAKPEWWPQETHFDSSPQPIHGIYYGGPEPDTHDPHAPFMRKRSGGSSPDMVWVILEELGRRKIYIGNYQGVPKTYQREFNTNYIKIWRRRWEEVEVGKKAKEWMLKEYPPARFPEWARLWTEQLV